MTDFNDAQYELGRELVGAGHRLQAQKKASRSGSRVLRFGAPLMAGLAIIAGIIGFNLTRQPSPASAQVFIITELTDRVELEVIDIITNPQDVEEQLIKELGLSSELDAAPVHPAFIGKIVAVGTTGDSEPEYDIQPDGSVHSITLAEGFNGTLIISYGRQAEGAEIYNATVEELICGQLWGQNIVQTRPLLEQQADQVKYETIDTDLTVQTEVDPNSINPNYGLTSASYTSNNTLAVTYAANPDDEPRTHPNCQ